MPDVLFLNNNQADMVGGKYETVFIVDCIGVYGCVWRCIVMNRGVW